MTHVSKRELKAKTSLRVKKNFFEAIFAMRNRRVLEVLLTRTETLMLAKRLAILIMLERTHSYYRIQKTLNVSVSTIMRLDKARRARVFLPIQRAISRGDDLSLPERLELILAAGMPSIAGPRHQKRLNELRRKARGA